MEPVLAISYAMLLVLVAAGLEWMGRHSSRRADRYHTRGFRFHEQTDHWECPEGARLIRAEIDNELRVIRYRAPAHTCNACAIKTNCTDSTAGREIAVAISQELATEAMDPWLRSAIGRFHRGISLVLVLLATLILAIELFRSYRGPERWMLSMAVVAASSISLHLARNLVREPDRRP